MASSSSSAAAPPPVAQKSFLRRIVLLFLIANVAVGVFVLTRTSKKKPIEKPAVEVPPASFVSKEATCPENKLAVETPTPVKTLPPIREHEQRELLKWILEEQRKIKPKDSSEKMKINEEKALIKELLGEDTPTAGLRSSSRSTGAPRPPPPLLLVVHPIRYHHLRRKQRILERHVVQEGSEKVDPHVPFKYPLLPPQMMEADELDNEE